MLIRTLSIITEISWPLKLFGLLLSFLAPLSSLIHVIVLLLIVDAITSIYYQIKLKTKDLPSRRERWKQGMCVIESDKLRKTIEKLVFYVLIIIVFYSFDVYVIKVKPITATEIHTFSITNLAAVMIALVEMTSIASNISKITNNDIFERIVKMFKKKVDKKFDVEE